MGRIQNVIHFYIESYYLKEYINDKLLRLSVTKVDPEAMESGILEIINEIENSTSKHDSSIQL